MKVAIVGSSGYIGSYLYTNLKNTEVVGYDIFETLYSNFEIEGKEIEPSEYDIIIYLAGLTTRDHCKNIDMSIVQEKNVDDLMVLAKKMSSSQLLIYASTAGIMEGYLEEEGNETSTVNEHLLDPYSLSLYYRERQIKQLLNINTVGLRFGTVIGISPRQRSDLCYISMIKTAVLKGEISVQYPECKRNILWNQDLLRVMMTIIENKRNIIGHRLYNIGSFNTTIQTIADDIYKNTKINYSISIPGGTNVGFYMSNKLFCKDFNFTFEGTSELIIKELKENIGYLCIDQGLIGNTCRVCKSSNLSTVLNLGYQPLANNYLGSPQTQIIYPLCIVRCEDCNHTQLNYTVNPSVLFRNYQYESGTSYTLREYFLHLAEKCVYESGKKTGKILELACNDGSQLDEFKKLGWETYGVDPAINLSKPAEERGHTISCGFWGKDDIELPEMDIIVAQNVLAHVPDPVTFLSACTKVMNEDTLLYIQTSQCNMYVNGEFDTIYHEHLSYFTISSMMKCAELCRLSIVNIEKPSIHGVSYLFTMKLKTENLPTHSEKIMEEYNKEKDIGLYENDFYLEYQEKVKNVKSFVNETIYNFKSSSTKIIAYGAAAKGMTLLNYCGVTDISYIVDDSTLKHGKYTPGTNISILPVDEIKKEKGEICMFVLAWNFLDEIIKKIKELISNTEITKVQVITAFPTPVIKTIYNIQSTLISHIYNEEYLLPFWLNHHKGIFDNLIIIDHRCTDNSLQICRDLWPNCKIIKSKTTSFSAHETDLEVMEIEKTISGIKVALNVTEFMVVNGVSPFDKETSNIKIKDMFLKMPGNHCYSVVAISPYSNVNYEVNTNLELYKNLLCQNFKFHKDRGHRYIHSYSHGNYGTGRHDTGNPQTHTDELHILWFGYYPMNDKLLKRKLQIGACQPSIDIQYGLGFQHQFSKEHVLRIMEENFSTGITFEEINKALYETTHLGVTPE